MTQNPTQRRPSPSVLSIPFSRDPHPVRSTGQCRVGVSVSWTDPQSNNGFRIRDPQSSSSLCHHQPQPYGSRTRVPEARPCPPPWWEPGPRSQPRLFCSSCLFWPSLWHSGLGRNAGSPGPPPPVLHSGRPQRPGHYDSHSSHRRPRGPFFEGGVFSGFLRKQRLWQGFRTLEGVGRDGGRGRERRRVRTWPPVQKKVLEPEPELRVIPWSEWVFCICQLLTVSSQESESLVGQLCPTLCHPVDCSLPGSSIHGIFQARVLEWVAIAFSRGSSRPRDQTQVSHIVGGALLSEPPGKSQEGEFLTSWTGGSSQLRALLVVGGGDGRRPPIGQMAGQSISCKDFQSLPGRPLSFHQG